jgi:hypothetical protein
MLPLAKNRESLLGRGHIPQGRGHILKNDNMDIPRKYSKILNKIFVLFAVANFTLIGLNF